MRSRHGFTLVELLVIIAIITILVALGDWELAIRTKHVRNSFLERG